MPAPPTHRVLRVIAAALLAFTAVNHGVLAWRGEGNVARHAVFVGINLVLATLLVRWPKWALPCAALLSMQQIPSHGSDLLASLRGPGPVDFASLGVLLFFPALLTLLVLERRARPSAVAARSDGASAVRGDSRP